MEIDAEVPEDLTRAVVRGAGLASVLTLASQAVALAFYIAMARLTTPAVFGAFAAASIIVGFAGLFAESGMQSAVIQRRDRIEEAAATAVVATLAGGAALALVALGASALVGLYFHSREIGYVAASLSGLLFLNAVPLVPGALMQRRFMTMRRTILEPITAVAYGLGTTVALAAGMGIWGFVVGSYAGAVVRAACTWSFLGWLPDLRKASIGMWRELAAFGRHVVVSEFLRELSNIANIALVGRFLGKAPLGHYRAAWRLTTQSTLPIMSASIMMLLPAFSRIAGDELRLRAAAMRALRLQCVAMFAVGLAFVGLGEQIVVVLLGEQWRPAGHVLSALGGLFASLPLLMTAAEVFKSVGRPAFLARVQLLSAIATIAMIVAFLPLGATGVGGGVSIAGGIVALFSARALAQLFGISVRGLLAELVAPALAAIGMGAVLIVIGRLANPGGGTLEQLGILVGEVAVGAAVYLLLLGALNRSLVHELFELRRFRSRVPAGLTPEPRADG